MEIIRIENAVEKSRIKVEKSRIKMDNSVSVVSDLPDGLKNKLAAILKKMPGVKYISFSLGPEDALFDFLDRFVPLDHFSEEIADEFVEAIKLLQWYNVTHWSSDFQGAVGGPVHCVHCGYEALPMQSQKYCPVPGCPSHKMWRQIIGPSYKPPKKDPYIIPHPRIRKAAQEVQKLIKAARR